MKHQAEQFRLFPDEKLTAKSLLDEKSVSNPSSNEIWKRREVDELLDFYLSGADLGRIAASLHRNRKAIVRKLQEYIYNERDRVVNYQTRQRMSRKGKRITKNEQQIIEECRKKKVPWNKIAEVLARDVSEIDGGKLQPSLDKVNVTTINTLDAIMACRYAFHNYKIRIVPDKTYDAMVEEEIEYGGGEKAVAMMRLTLPEHCPQRVKTLALYLVEKFELKPK